MLYQQKKDKMRISKGEREGNHDSPSRPSTFHLPTPLRSFRIVRITGFESCSCPCTSSVTQYSMDVYIFRHRRIRSYLIPPSPHFSPSSPLLASTSFFEGS